jgi:uncharacterized protein YcfL
MKAIKIIAILIVLTSVFLTGCQSAEPTATTGPEESAYPLDEAYSDEGYPIYDYGTNGDSAYPVFPIDATQLTQVQDWVLAETKVNNQSQTPAKKAYSFLADGRYSLTTDGGTTEGTWSVDTFSGIPMLLLNQNTDQAQSFEIVILDAAGLTLKFEQDGTLIEELYHPAN